MNDWRRSSPHLSSILTNGAGGPPEVLHRLGRRPMHVEVLNRLRGLIIEGKLRAGEHINESELADFLDVSRTPLREALMVLQDEGLVVHEPNKGSRVAPINADQAADLFEVLAGIEGFGGKLAVGRMTAGERQRLAALQREMAERYAAGDRAGYFELNENLHRAYVALSGNPLLTAIHERHRHGVRRFAVALGALEPWDDAPAEHEAITEAIESGDAEGAANLIEAHTREAGRFVTARLRQLQPEQPRARRRRSYERRPGF